MIYFPIKITDIVKSSRHCGQPCLCYTICGIASLKCNCGAISEQDILTVHYQGRMTFMTRTRSYFRNVLLILTLLSIVLIIPLVCSATGNHASQSSNSNAAYKLTYDGNEFVVSSTGTLQLHIFQTASGSDLSDHVIWLSSAPNIATIDKTGLVSGKKVGETEISCLSLDGKTTFAKAKIKVVAGVKSAVLSDSKCTLLLGTGVEKSTATLAYTVQPENAYFQGVTWFSSDNSIATVDANGRINAVAVGT